MSSRGARPPRSEARDSVSQTSPAMIPATPIGILTNRTHRQDSVEVSTPPRIDPAAPPAPATALQIPSAQGRRSGANVVTMIVKVAGDSSAPPMPWTARAAVSQAESCATPPARLATVKSPRPNRNTRRRPNRSAARPPRSRNPANVST
jgi:hypothetical protein